MSVPEEVLEAAEFAAAAAEDDSHTRSEGSLQPIATRRARRAATTATTKVGDSTLAAMHVLHAIQGWRWHVVPGSATLSMELGIQVSLPPDDVQGVLLISELSCQPHCAQTVSLLSQSEARVPIIVFLLCSVSSPVDPELVLDVQHKYLAAGADDVILRPHGGKEAVQLAIRMGLQRARRRFMDQAFAEGQLQHLRKMLHKTGRQTMSEGAQKNNLFWSCAPQVFEGFPEIDETNDPGHLLKAGDRTGPCVLGRKLGQGAFGRVFLATNEKTGEAEALKVFDKHRIQDLASVEKIWQEIKFLRRLQHPLVVALRGVAHTSRQIVVRMELAGQQSLCHAILAAGGRLDAATAWRVGHQVAGALAYCHSEGVAHRDVKPENVSFRRGHGDAGAVEAKLIDFGLAVEAGGAGSFCCGELVGTMPFVAPEVLLACEPATMWNPDGDPDPRCCDVWAHGVLVLESSCGLGEFNRMVSWPINTVPDRELVAGLVAFFQEPANLAAALGASAAAAAAAEADSAEAAEAADAGGSSGGYHQAALQALRALLQQELVVDPARRASAAQVSRHMAARQPDFRG